MKSKVKHRKTLSVQDIDHVGNRTIPVPIGAPLRSSKFVAIPKHSAMDVGSSFREPMAERSATHHH